MSKYLFILLLTGIGHAEEKKFSESYYRDAWAKSNKGTTEVQMGDKTRCDVITKTHAIEVEWANKWTEGIGQALWYSFQTNKKAGIVLILKDEDEHKHLRKLQSLIKAKNLDITVWTIQESDLRKDAKTQ